MPHVERVLDESDLVGLRSSAGLRDPRPVLVLVGGAGGLSDAEVDRLTDYLAAHVLPSIRTAGAAVVDGGTDAGVMRAAGRMRGGGGEASPFPLIGVIARGLLPGDRESVRGVDDGVVEPHHSHLVVVPGETWGDEVPWLGRVARVLAEGQPTATLLVNGGEIAYQDMRDSLRHDRPVVVLAGSGRTADDVAAAAEDASQASTEARVLAASPLTHVVPYTDGQQLREVLTTLLGGAMIDG